MTGQMWRVVSVYRVITLVYAATLLIRDLHGYAHPVAGLIVLTIMTGWTCVTVIAYSRPQGRRGWLIGADLVVAAGLILSGRTVLTTAAINAGAPTLPSSWAASPVLACAVAGGPWAGLAGGVVVSAADVAERRALLPQTTFNGVVLLLIAGVVGGFVVRFGQRAEQAVARAARHDAALSERERIARGVHDSVLQVLALVSTRGRALGGEAAELGQLAAEQEEALRKLLSMDYVDDPGSGLVDVRSLAEALRDTQAQVSCPATPVLLPSGLAESLGGAMTAALDNVRRHAGDSARAWVLVEDDGCEVRVTVRDDGAGFPETRLAEAAAAGRLGVSHSIAGRLRAVGGTACVTSAPGQGTEVELRVPRP
jgi:signal transduction histidine kinase